MKQVHEKAGGPGSRWVFDPFGWLERWIPSRWLHRGIRFLILLILLGFLVRHSRAYGQFLFKPLWIVEGLLYGTFLLAYLVRTDPRERSRGAAEILLPLAGAVLPFLLLLTPPASWIAGRTDRQIPLFAWMALTSALTLWGLWTLRRSFSITVEVRSLVTGGPYRWIRHPIYLGEILTAGAVMVWRISLVNAIIYLVFIGIQGVRARREEDTLLRAFPEYGTYREKSRWFW